MLWILYILWILFTIACVIPTENYGFGFFFSLFIIIISVAILI